MEPWQGRKLQGSVPDCCALCAWRTALYRCAWPRSIEAGTCTLRPNSTCWWSPMIKHVTSYMSTNSVWSFIAPTSLVEQSDLATWNNLSLRTGFNKDGDCSARFMSIFARTKQVSISASIHHEPCFDLLISEILNASVMAGYKWPRQEAPMPQL